MENLPLTNISLFDTRHEKTWREELNGYLLEEVPLPLLYL